MSGSDPSAGARYHHGNLRAALLERAATTIETEGVENLSLRQLARDLGVSHGAPARHFRDKKALLNALAQDAFVDLNARLDAAAVGEVGERLESAPEPTVGVAERIERITRAYVAFTVENRALLPVMFSMAPAPDARPRLPEIRRAVLATITDLIRAAQAAGEIAPGDADRLAPGVFAAMHGLATLAAADVLDDAQVEEAIRATTDLLGAGLTIDTGTDTDTDTDTGIGIDTGPDGRRAADPRPPSPSSR